MRTKTQLESRLENVFPGSKVELRRECEQHHGIVERNNLELEEVGGASWAGRVCGYVGVVWCSVRGS